MIALRAFYRRRIVLLLALGAAGCDGRVLDPTKSPTTWTPEGINSQNIAASVVDPTDLSQGRGDEGSDGQQMAQAVRRWRQLLPSGFTNETGTPAAGGSAPVGGGESTGAGSSGAGTTGTETGPTQ